MPPNVFFETARTWNSFGLAYSRMMWSANEVIWRRSLQMALGTMTPGEATRMIFEKPTAFARSTEMAARAIASGRGVAEASLAGVRPIAVKTRSNARRLRK